MNDKRYIRMAETIANSGSINNNNLCKDNELMELKQLLSRISEILDNSNFVQTQGNNKEIRISLKELIIKSVDMLA